MWKKVIQAPMAGVQGFELAAAVYKAGGMGSIPCAMITPEQILQEVKKFREATSQNDPNSPIDLNLNFFAHQEEPLDPSREASWVAALEPFNAKLPSGFKPPPPPANRKSFNEEHLAVVKNVLPRVVSFHFGLPPPEVVEELQKLGIQTFISSIYFHIRSLVLPLFNLSLSLFLCNKFPFVSIPVNFSSHN